MFQYQLQTAIVAALQHCWVPIRRSNSVQYICIITLQHEVVCTNAELYTLYLTLSWKSMTYVHREKISSDNKDVSGKTFRYLPPVSLASPVSHPPSPSHSLKRALLAALWMAPSTPPPPSSEQLAAFTMASISR